MDKSLSQKSVHRALTLADCSCKETSSRELFIYSGIGRGEEKRRMEKKRKEKDGEQKRREEEIGVEK